MASVLLILALSVLGVQGAVLNTADTLLKRIARSPSCDKCSGHPNPPSPPRPLSFGKGGPPPPLLGSSFSGASASATGGGRQNGFKSGASASAQASVAGYNNHGQKDARFSGKQIQQNGFQGVGGGYKNGQKGVGNSGRQQEGVGQFRDALGSLGGAQGGLSPGKGCSTCEKSNSAISNAKSNSGSATAIAVNG